MLLGQPVNCVACREAFFSKRARVHAFKLLCIGQTDRNRSCPGGSPQRILVSVVKQARGPLLERLRLIVSSEACPRVLCAILKQILGIVSVSECQCESETP